MPIKKSPRVLVIDLLDIVEETKAILVENKVNLCVKKHIPVKYDKKKYLEVYLGYDFLENICLVRKYVIAKYKTNNKILEMLLYFAPKQFFTRYDMVKLPRSFTYCKSKSFIQTELFKVVIDHRFEAYKVFGLTARGREVVKCFYECLSGERALEWDYKTHTIRKYDKKLYCVNKNTKIEEKTQVLLKEIYEKPIPETKSHVFT